MAAPSFPTNTLVEAGTRPSSTPATMLMPSESSSESDSTSNPLSPRKRRNQLNDLLYSLRSVAVPIGTKQLDKASILNHTVTYLQQLKHQVEDLEKHISILKNEKDDFLAGASDDQLSTFAGQGVDNCISSPKHKILQLNVVDMGQKAYQIHVCCEKDNGALLQFTKALEAMNLNIENANVYVLNNAQMLYTLVVKVESGHKMKMTSKELKESILRSASVYGIGFCPNADFV